MSNNLGKTPIASPVNDDSLVIRPAINSGEGGEEAFTWRGEKHLEGKKLAELVTGSFLLTISSNYLYMLTGGG